MQKEQLELEQKVARALHEARAKADNIISSAESQSRQVSAGSRKKKRS